MRYKGARKPLALIASELGVDAIVEGTILHAGQRVRITAQLVRVRDDRHLWAEKYERDLNDVLALQAEVAQAIAVQIQARLTPQPHSRSAKPRPVNIQAYEVWLEASYFRNKVSEASSRKSLELFQKAIDLDPTYAPSYAGLAESYCMLGIIGSRPPLEVYPRAKAAALRALELDDTCEQAHNSLAEVKKSYDWDWMAAEAEYKRALY